METRGVELGALQASRVTVGRGPDNDVPLGHDRMASSLHAVLAGWCVRDLGSRNGTLLRGERILGDCALRNGDEQLIGRTRLVFRADASPSMHPTQGAEPAPSLTPPRKGHAACAVPPAGVEGRLQRAGVTP